MEPENTQAQTSADLSEQVRTSANSHITDIPPDERFTLTPEQAAEIFDEYGVHRDVASIRRYCRQGKIKATDEIEGQFGREWLINETDTRRFALKLKNLELGRKQSRGISAEPDKPTEPVPTPVAPTNDAPDEETIEAELTENVSTPMDAPVQPVELRIENARLSAENSQLVARLEETKDRYQQETDFLRGQVQNANLVAERASRDAEQYKILLANKDEQFKPLVEAAADVTRQTSSRTTSLEARSVSVDDADIEDEGSAI